MKWVIVNFFPLTGSKDPSMKVWKAILGNQGSSSCDSSSLDKSLLSIKMPYCGLVYLYRFVSIPFHWSFPWLHFFFYF